MIVLGIDPGTACTGYGVVKGDGGLGTGLVSLVECGVIRTKARDPLASRLHEIYEGVAELLQKHRPDALCVEDRRGRIDGGRAGRRRRGRRP